MSNNKEEDLKECYKHCLKLTYSKLSDIYSGWKGKVIGYILLFLTGVVPVFFIFFLLTSNIQITTFTEIQKPVGSACLDGNNYGQGPFQSQMYFYWNIGCFNISLGDYDTDYKDYEIALSRIFYETRYGYVNQKNVNWKEPVSAYGFVKTPQYEFKQINYQSQKFILVNTSIEKIEIPQKEGEIKILEIITVEGVEMVKMRFIHTISIWEYLQNFYIK